jgi:hypothetical protein
MQTKALKMAAVDRTPHLKLPFSCCFPLAEAISENILMLQVITPWALRSGTLVLKADRVSVGEADALAHSMRWSW